ncbi:hypothetical protein PHYC_03158 [Phycisphaerales bacterium]|nr:hypothetical protein PHYC_03158 [Phycisphaerales bacterium]
MSDRLPQLLRLLNADPNDAFTLYAIAQEHAKKSEHSQAVTFYDRCLAVDPTYLYAYYHKARSLACCSQKDDAIATANAGLAAAKKADDSHAASELLALVLDLKD